ncbi:hypothetical protein D3C78_468520 [compost metagenome]
MLFKYDLDKFDPLGTKKIQETIATMTKPSRDWAAIVNPNSKIQDEIAALYKNNPLTRAHASLDAITDSSYNKAFANMVEMQKSIALTKTQARIAASANPYSKIQDEIAALYKNNPLTRAHASLDAITDSSYNKAFANMVEMQKSIALTKTQARIAASANPYSKIQDEIAALYKNNPLTRAHASLDAITDSSYNKAFANMVEMQKSIALTKTQANIAAMADPYGIAKTREALSRQAFSIAHNDSLGLHSDVKRLIAATTLNPELNAKIRNFNQTVVNLSWLTGQNSKQQNLKSTQDYLETIEKFNDKYSQELNIDEVTVQALDLVIQDQDTSNLVSELTHIGIFDTSNGSILYEFAETLPEEKKGHFLYLILSLLVFLFNPVLDNFEPLKQQREKLENLINRIEGKAVIIKDCDLRYKPNGRKMHITLEKESIIQVYISKDRTQEWVKIKYNKDGHDVQGYIRTSELIILDETE